MGTPVEALGFGGFPVAVTFVEGRGRGLVTTRDVKGGELVLQESPLLLVVDETAKCQCCSNCFKMPELVKEDGSEGSLPFKCRTCQEVYFCSQQCLEAATASSHSELVCSALQNLKTSDLTDEEKDQVRFVVAALDLPLRKDVEGPAPFKLLLNLSGTGEPSSHRESLYQFLEQAAKGNTTKLLSPKAGSTPASPAHFTTASSAVSPSASSAGTPAASSADFPAASSTDPTSPAPAVVAGESIIQAPALAPIATGSINRRFIAALLAKDKQTAYGLMAPSKPGEDRKLRASGVYPRCSLLNHDCLPNVARFDYLDKEGTSNADVQIRALHDIPAGTELHQSYFPVATSYYERQQRLLEEYGFDCKCTRCGIEAAWSDDDDDESDIEDEDDEDSASPPKVAPLEEGVKGAAVAPERAAEEVSALSMQEQHSSKLEVVGKGKGKVSEETTHGEAKENDFEHAFFFVKYLCPVEGCGGTMAPEPGKWTGGKAGEGEYVPAGRMECNMCGLSRTDAEFVADLEQHRMEGEIDVE